MISYIEYLNLTVDYFQPPTTVEFGTQRRPWAVQRGAREKAMMEWTRSDTIVLAKQSCAQCNGLGLKSSVKGKSSPCNCVFRAVFRACYARFRHCATKEKYMSKATPELIAGREGRLTWGRKDEEYVADFCQVSRKALDDLEYKVFRYHFLLGADWRLCTRKLSIDRGSFFHAVYRIEQKLGRAFRELEPYGLFPVDEYFHGARQSVQMRAHPASGPQSSLGPLRPPFRPSWLPKTA